MRSTGRLAFLLLLAVLVGCSFLTPKTYQLEQIHQTYTAEWAAVSLPTAGGTPAIVDGSGSFRKTLDGIQNYKKKYGKNTRVAAHLTVLEGMIYLQSGAPGMAKLLKPEVADAEQRLKSPAGVVTRDYIFARCYPSLVKGWEAIYKKGVNVVPTDFSNPADTITNTLNEIPVEERAASDVDSGGAYVATSAAIFYVWANAAEPSDEMKKKMAAKGEEVLRPWLSDQERTAVKNGTYKNKDLEWGNRLRYLEWYEWLHKNAVH